VPTKDIIDEEIAQEIKNALKRNLQIKDENITVEVSKGYVTLTGVVPSVEEKRKAEEKSIQRLSGSARAFF
jgi:osmotically-inducible protein OsmY